MSLVFLHHLPQHTAFAVLQPLLAESREQMGETIALCVRLRQDKRIRSLERESSLVILLHHLVRSCGNRSGTKSQASLVSMAKYLGHASFRAAE